MGGWWWDVDVGGRGWGEWQWGGYGCQGWDRRWGIGIGEFGEAAEEFAAFEGFGDFDGAGVGRGGDAIPSTTECGEDDDACAVVGGLEHEALWVGLIKAGDVDDDLIPRREVLEGDIEGGDVVNDQVPLLTLEV